MEHAVIAHLLFAKEEFGSASERQAVIDLEHVLERAIQAANAGEFDGDEYGGGECVLFMYGPDADRLFAVVGPILAASPLARGGHAIKRYGPASDPTSAEVRIDW
jgi:hypothetical protein